MATQFFTLRIEMAQQATLLVLFLVFAAAILIQFMLIKPSSTIELFKGKKKSKKSSKKSKGKKKSSKKSKGKKKSSKSKGKKKSSKSKDKKKSSKGMAGAKTTSGDYVNCPKGYTCSPSGASPLSFSEVVGSLLSPSLPDSRDMKDKLHAAVDSSYSGQTPANCPSDSTNCAIASRQMGNPAIPASNCANGLTPGPAPYNSNDYIRKDSIPCYGCNLK